MTETEKLRNAKDFIVRELQKKSSSRIDAMSWGQGLIDPAAGIYRLAIHRGAESSVFAFTKDELFNNHGSKQWEKQLRIRVSDILMEL